MISPHEQKQIEQIIEEMIPPITRDMMEEFRYVLKRLLTEVCSLRKDLEELRHRHDEG